MGIRIVAALAPSASAAPLAFGPERYIDESFPGGEPVLFADTIHPVGGGTGPAAGTTPAPGARLPSSRRCTSRRGFKIHLRNPKGQRLAGARVYVNGKCTRVLRRHGRLHAVVDLRTLKKGRYTVKIVALTSQGRQVVSQRRYRTCTPKRR